MLLPALLILAGFLPAYALAEWGAQFVINRERNRRAFWATTAPAPSADVSGAAHESAEESPLPLHADIQRMSAFDSSPPF